MGETPLLEALFRSFRLNEEHRVKSPTNLTDLQDLKTSFQYHLLGSAVPMAIAKQARRQWYNGILKQGG